MTGFTAFLGKELRETRRTWRIWVLPGILLFLGLSTPILTAATPYILEMTAQSTPGMVIELSTPAARDAYLGFMGNLTEIALLVIVITGAASVAGECRAGTTALMLTKPLSRAGFIVAKTVSGLVVTVVATALGAALCIVVTIALFGAAHIAGFLTAVLVWLALAAMFATLMVFLSAAMGRQAPAAGVGVAVYVALFVLTGFPALRDHTPAGLLAAGDALLDGRHVALAAPLTTTLVLAAVFLGAAVVAFRRKEL